MAKVQLGARIEQSLKDTVQAKMEAEGKTWSILVEELFEAYLYGGVPEQVQTQQLEVAGQEKVTNKIPSYMQGLPDDIKKPEEFEYHLDWVDYLEKQGLLD